MRKESNAVCLSFDSKWSYTLKCYQPHKIYLKRFGFERRTYDSVGAAAPCVPLPVKRKIRQLKTRQRIVIGGPTIKQRTGAIGLAPLLKSVVSHNCIRTIKYDWSVSRTVLIDTSIIRTPLNDGQFQRTASQKTQAHDSLLSILSGLYLRSQSRG